jgi:Double zinc ribbon
MHVRVCRNCGEEYRPEVLVCTDCGGPLEDRDDELEAPARSELSRAETTAAEVTSPPPMPLSLLHQTSLAAEMDPLAARLGAAHVPFTVRWRGVFELLVPEQYVPAARALLGPELSIGPELDPEAGAYARCPACQAELAAGAAACSDCGLEIGPLEEPSRCPRCGAVAEPFATGKACPFCGYRD